MTPEEELKQKMADVTNYGNDMTETLIVDLKNKNAELERDLKAFSNERHAFTGRINDLERVNKVLENVVNKLEEGLEKLYDAKCNSPMEFSIFVGKTCKETLQRAREASALAANREKSK